MEFFWNFDASVKKVFSELKSRNESNSNTRMYKGNFFTKFQIFFSSTYHFNQNLNVFWFFFQRLDKINVKLAALSGKLCQKSELKVDFNVEKYARQTISKNQKELNDFISNNWIEKCTSNPRLYNASKFRLASFHCDENEIKIQVGITSYKVKKVYFLHKNPF